MQHQIKVLFIAASLLIGPFTLPSSAQDKMKDKGTMEGKDKSKMASDKMADDKAPGDQDKMKDEDRMSAGKMADKGKMVQKEKMKGKMAKRGKKGKKSDNMEGDPMKDSKMKAGTMKEAKP